jgi:hypothetical protein
MLFAARVTQALLAATLPRVRHRFAIFAKGWTSMMSESNQHSAFCSAVGYVMSRNIL